MALTQISTGMLASGDGTVDLNIDNGTFVVDVSTSRVGIGTSSPVSKLDIASGDLTISNSTNAPFINFVDNTTRSQSLARIAMDQVSGTAGQLLFSTTTGGTLAERMRIDSSGNVGIGTSSPRSILDLDGGSETQLRLQTTNSGSAASDGLLISLDSSTNAKAYIWNYENAETIFGTNNAERMRIDASGRVGIGAVAPTDGTLHVQTASAGTVAASTQADDIVIENNAEGGMTIITPDDQSARIRFTSPSTNTDVGGAHIFYRQNINKMNIGTTVSGGKMAILSGAGNETMLLDSAGNVGIGTPDPDNTLHVHKGSAGTVDGNTNAPLTLENSAANYLQMLAPNNSETGILFGNPANSADSGIIHSDADNTLAFRVGSNSTKVILTSDGNIVAQSATQNRIVLGSTGNSSNNTSNWVRGNQGYLQFNSASAGYTWEIGGAEKMRVTSAGKLLVEGTVAGYSGTQITVGSPSITTSGLSILSTTSGHGYLMFGDATGDAAAGYIGQIHYGHSSGTMDIVTNGVKAVQWDSGGLQIANQVLADGRRRGMYGIYSATHIAHIWGMGVAYKIATNGSNAGNLYGLCYSYEPNYSVSGTNPGARAGLGHQMQWRANGATHTAIGNGIYTVGSVTANSDARLKTDIETIPNAMSKVSALTGITYKRTDLSEPDSATGNQYDVRHTGILAQDLLTVLPEAVEGAVNGQQPEDGSYLSVAYGNMAGLFVEALKEQQATIEALTQRIETLENN